MIHSFVFFAFISVDTCEWCPQVVTHVTWLEFHNLGATKLVWLWLIAYESSKIFRQGFAAITNIFWRGMRWLDAAAILGQVFWDRWSVNNMRSICPQFWTLTACPLLQFYQRITVGEKRSILIFLFRVLEFLPRFSCNDMDNLSFWGILRSPF